MVYDSNGFNFNGNSILENFDNTYPGGNTSSFQKNGADIGTLVTCVGSHSGREAFRDTTLNLGYTTVISNSVVDIDEIFCTEKPKPTITINKNTSNESNNSDYRVERSKNTDDDNIYRTRYSFFTQWPNNLGSGVYKGWSNYELVVSDVGVNCSARILLVAGGGAGGTRPYYGYNAGGGAGGGGEVKLIANHTLEPGTYAIHVGSGGRSNGNEGENTYMTGPSIPTAVVAKGGGAGGYSSDRYGDAGGSGGGGMNGGSGGTVDSGSNGGLSGVESYGYSGGGSNNDGGGGGGGGAGGTGGSGSGHAPGNGGIWKIIDGKYLSGGGSGRSRYTDSNGNNLSYHGTDYGGNTQSFIVYGGGGRGDENSTRMGIVTIAFDEDDAIEGNTLVQYTYLGGVLNNWYVSDL
tara:strand:+ start:1407 stop:2621 length:1215 start_codon:yes stop_codon:yes gene_type:complete